MANKLYQNPIVVDTEMATVADGLATGNHVHVIGMYWTGATAAHKLSVKDGASKRIWAAVAETNNTEKSLSITDEGFIMDGLFVDDLDGGVLYIYTL